MNDRLRGELWRDAIAIAVLALAALIFFWPVVTGQAWLPKGGGDSVSFLYPMYRFAADSLRAGTIPFWNPYQYAGAPFLSDNQSGVFYPFNLVVFLLWPDFSYRAIETLVIWHFFFAGLGMYLCLRLMQTDRPLRRPAALLGALAFMLSDVFITHIGNLNLIAVAAWLPLVFLGLHRAVASDTLRKGLPWALGGGAALGIATLAGHGQMTFLIAAFLGVYAVFQVVVNRRFRAIPLLGLLGIFAVLLAGISLFPAAGTLEHTLRAEFDYERITNYALPPQGLAGLVAPDFFGRGDAFWGDWLRVEYGYIGVVTLFLAIAAVILRPNRQTFFFVLAGLFFLLLALGPATPLYPLLGRLLPSFPFQVPARFVLLLNFSLATLGAIGLDALMDAQRKDRRLTGLLVGSALAGFGMLAMLLVMRAGLSETEPQRAGQMVRAVIVFAALAAGSWLILASALSRRILPAILPLAAIGLLFVDLYGLGRHVEIEWNNPMPGFAEDSAALAYLRGDPGIHRVDIVSGAWQPNMPMIEGLFAARGVYNPLQLANYNVYMGSVGFRGSILYNLMGIKYLIGGKKEPPGDTHYIIPVYEKDQAVTIYLNTLALPRAMVVYNSEVVGNHNDAFEAVHGEGFDPSRLVVLEGGQQLFQEPGQATIEIMRYDGNEVAFNVTIDRPGYFVLSDVFHPDWQAEVDGVPSAIEVANYAFRAIYLEAGNHTVTMHFLPSGWIAGVVATGLALVTLIALGIQQARNYRKFSISPADESFSR